MSGVSGAGRKAEVGYLFAECNESLRPYNVVSHRHLSEIEQELAKAAGCPAVTINFLPHLVPVNRGIHTTLIANLAKPGTTAEDIGAALSAAYPQEPFVRILPPGELADTKHVTMTNTCEIGYAVCPRTRRVIVSSAIDNLTKGGSGQAVQCFNIMAGCAETAGLQ
jgi:N-acetyl-gamma-glutamyl-phosphate reductase